MTLPVPTQQGLTPTNISLRISRPTWGSFFSIQAQEVGSPEWRPVGASVRAYAGSTFIDKVVDQTEFPNSSTGTFQLRYQAWSSDPAQGTPAQTDVSTSIPVSFGQRLYTVNSNQSGIEIHDPATATLLKSISVSPNYNCYGVMPSPVKNRKECYALGTKLNGGGGNRLIFLDEEINSVIAEISVSFSQESGEGGMMQISPDGSKAYISDGVTYIQVINLDTRAFEKNLTPYPTGTKIEDIALSPDGTKLYVAVAAPNIELSGVCIDTATGVILSKFVVAAEGIATQWESPPYHYGFKGNKRIAVSRDGTRVAIIGGCVKPEETHGVNTIQAVFFNSVPQGSGTPVHPKVGTWKKDLREASYNIKLDSTGPIVSQAGTGVPKFHVTYFTSLSQDFPPYNSRFMSNWIGIPSDSFTVETSPWVTGSFSTNSYLGDASDEGVAVAKDNRWVAVVQRLENGSESVSCIDRLKTDQYSFQSTNWAGKNSQINFLKEYGTGTGVSGGGGAGGNTNTVPEWLSPSNGATITSLSYFEFKVPTHEGNEKLEFELEVSTNSSFTQGVVSFSSENSRAGWEISPDGISWSAMTGPQFKGAGRFRFRPPVALSVGSKFVRARAVKTIGQS